MKQRIEALLDQALARLVADGLLGAPPGRRPPLERARQKGHGDYASSLALALARAAGQPPRALAERLVAALPEVPWLEKVEIAGPGFINFFLSPAAYQGLVGEILRRGADYGRCDLGGGRRVHLEYVSANPTGPLHVGHGRGAAYGDALARILAFAGYRVHREYYVNDAGRQMDILAVSVYLRYLELCGEAFDYPARAYQGDYIWDIAAGVHRGEGERLRHPASEVFVGLPSDSADDHLADPEAHLDGLIARCKALLGATDYARVLDAALHTLLDDIRRDLAEFGVEYDEWFSERSLTATGEVDKAVRLLKEHGALYEKDGAWWFRATDYGDEKDRVVLRDNGAHTYFASDIAYHLDKLERGFDQLIDIWGADHHGYVPRVRAAVQALGRDPEVLSVLLVQFAVLYRGREKVSMSTRGGDFVTLRELRQEVGNDAARFFYVSRKCEQHMDFDLELAKSQSNENPVYYVQYAHARIMSVYRELREQGHGPEIDISPRAMAVLTAPHELALLKRLARWPEVVEQAARQYEPHQVAYYLRELANDFHTYYNAHRFIVADAALRNARLALIAATRQVLVNGLGLIGVSAPERM